MTSTVLAGASCLFFIGSVFSVWLLLRLLIILITEAMLDGLIFDFNCELLSNGNNDINKSGELSNPLKFPKPPKLPPNPPKALSAPLRPALLSVLFPPSRSPRSFCNGFTVDC